MGLWSKGFLERMEEAGLTTRYSEITPDIVVHVKDIGKRAFFNVCVEEGCNIPEGEKDYLERGYSDSELELFEAIKMLVRDGMALEKSLNC